MALNQNLLRADVQDFIDKNYKKDAPSLVLKGSPFADINIQELLQQLESKRKAEKKLPTWFQTANIYFPPKVSIEQSSSEITAQYKASIVSGKSLIDVTGGFGIDSYYFAQQFESVTYCEINEDLAQVVAHNYEVLGQQNITVQATNGMRFIKEQETVYDWMFIDPSRRDGVKGKVFLLKDCVPYLPPKVDFLFRNATSVLVKLSPMLDISNTLKELKYVTEVHIVAVNNEVKELLFLLEQKEVAAVKIQTVNFQKDQQQSFAFNFGDHSYSNYSEPLQYLYEPNAALLKSGGFHEITKQLPVFKLQEHAHLYTSEALEEFPGRSFQIEAVVPYDRKKIQQLLPEKKANITTRNFPKSVVQIRKELKLKDGGQHYLFFTKNMKNKLTCILCKKFGKSQ
ncbi:MAG: SAM-dependent methyltransferase [Flavobacteriaceae bacterium]|nr:SAM-dependent methyltransferase [Flavobacteriaceae bacterium]